MTKFLLSVHVLAAILFIGPVTVSVSLFPRYATRALRADDAGDSAAVVRLLHRISRVYAVLGAIVPVFGIATAVQMRVLTNGWLVASIVLTAGAAALLAFVVLPAQVQMVTALPDISAEPPAPTAGADLRRVVTRMSMAAGLFGLLWTVVTILMIIRPGSTTGA